MKKNILLLIILMLAGKTMSQQTMTEVTNATSKYNDNKPNNDSVPNGYAIKGQFERIMIFRFKYKADLLNGMDSLVKVNGIKNAVILAGIGSVRDYHIHSVSNRNFPSKNIFVKDPTAPADIASMNGYVINGRVHAHMMLTYADKAFGGHLEPGTHVFTFAIITLGILNDSIDLSKVDDKGYR